MEKKIKFICIIGLDGSGKTTLAKRLVETLSQFTGERFVYRHSLIDARLIKPVLHFGKKVLVPGESRENNYKQFLYQKRLQFDRYPILFEIYRLFLFVDYLPQIWWQIGRPLIIGKRMISDRYIYDTCINFGLNRAWDAAKIIKLARAFFRLAPKPQLTFLIQIPAEIALCRKKDIPSIDYLKERISLYEALAHELKLIILDGTLPPYELAETALSYIRSRQ